MSTLFRGRGGGRVSGADVVRGFKLTRDAGARLAVRLSSVDADPNQVEAFPADWAPLKTVAAA